MRLTLREQVQNLLKHASPPNVAPEPSSTPTLSPLTADSSRRFSSTAQKPAVPSYPHLGRRGDLFSKGFSNTPTEAPPPPQYDT
ncbi:hypothetical protein AJ78_06564 [Emergomyces pasteurianus Ep9510]|uniref:Uncharacterized protein n=1 Tax=Emergomyces pasteurianus Ep9510 TaxID=1447872 RepID=A0A1J9Q9R3_9EURO|nr:hypothetical protein AJ78_06564 [Emergomyces pasteurianus Ep9510]